MTTEAQLRSFKVNSYQVLVVDTFGETHRYITKRSLGNAETNLNDIKEHMEHYKVLVEKGELRGEGAGFHFNESVMPYKDYCHAFILPVFGEEYIPA
jgi:hypothetical protein